MWGWAKKVGNYFGASSKGKDMSEKDSATEDSIQQALDKLVTGGKEFGNRSMKAGDAEKALREQGVLPPGWRLRESDSTSSGYRPTQAATKKMAAVHAGQIAAAASTGGMSLGVQAAVNAGLGAAQGGMGGGGWKGALMGGALGAGGAAIPGGATASLGRKLATSAGEGALGGLASGGGVKGALLGAGFGAAGVGAGKIAPSLTKSGIGQKAINFGVNTGLDTARTGQFNPLNTALNAGSTFAPDAAGRVTSNPMAQRALNFGANQGLNLARGGSFNPIEAGFGGLNVLKPEAAQKIQGYLPGRAQGGPVKKDEPYVVGEKGPEVVVPKTDGTVLPSATPAALATAKPAIAPTGAASGYVGGGVNAVDPSQDFGQRWGPLIAQGAGAVGGIYASRKAQQDALKRSPDEQAAIDAMTGPGGAPDVAKSLMGESRPYISKPASYYQTLLNGNRAAMAQAVAPQRAALNEGYRGAQTQLAHSNVRGAARDQLAGGLNRERASQVAGLTTGVQPAAAGALASLGQGLQASAVPLYGQGTSFYSQLLNNGLLNREYASKEGRDTGAQTGKLIADLGNTAFGKGAAPKAAVPAKKPVIPNAGPLNQSQLPGAVPAPQAPPQMPVTVPTDWGNLPGAVPAPGAPAPYSIPGGNPEWWD